MRHVLRRILIIILLLAFSNAAYGDTIEYPSPQEYTAAKIADMKSTASSNVQSQLGLGSIYADNSAGFQDLDQSEKWYERAFFRGNLNQLIGTRGDAVGNMQMWWHITTYAQIIQSRRDADYAFKQSYMNALLACNDESGANYYKALKYANLAQSYNRNPRFADRAQKLIRSLVVKINQEQVANKRKVRKY